MKIRVKLCLSVVLCVFFADAFAQQSPKDWYGKGLDASFHTQKIEYFSKAIELDENYVDAYNARATAKSDLGMLKEAIVDFGKVILLDSSNLFAYFNRASCNFALGKYEEAITDFDEVIRLKPAHAYAMSGKGCALMLQGNPEAAIEILNQALWLEGSLQSAVKCREEAIKKRDKPGNTNPVANKSVKGKPVETPPAKTNEAASKKSAEVAPAKIAERASKKSIEPTNTKTAETAAANTKSNEITGTESSALKLNATLSSIGVYKLTDATSLREGPVHTTRVLLRFNAGDVVELLEKTEAQWWKVRFKGKVGYAKSALLATAN